jgi:hypothetical protein
VRRAAALATVVLALAACGGSDSNAPVAHVGGEAIAKGQLQQAVDHFKDEAATEGKPFPKSGTDEYRTVQRQALGLLVYRSELLQSADKLGVPVSDQEVQQRMSSSSEQEGETAFAKDTVRSQIAYEHIYDRVTAGSTVSGREAAMRQWVEQMKQAYAKKVSYEAGYAPAS